ncbi:recombinase family protein [Mesorhizobium sp.]|uniref:recombinase family protein n=1 Tax=Mesorhizobium sp. TaxID=1871066 RepID=UPI00257F9655|nr:recombinase family protein [Mesorhizobium sp.]
MIYARYSSELQNAASIQDQVRVCRRRIDQEKWQFTQIYSDRALSGASHLRPGYQKLLEDARNGHFDIVLAESIDRLSRDQEHIASLFKLLTYRRIPLVTVAEGEISELHVGLKGTMSALYLKDLSQKTHRGLEGRVRQGRSAGGLSYGYDVDRSFGGDGLPKTGDRAINPAEAAIVRRIFSDFAAGKSPRTIATQLNRDGFGGPRGAPWGASTIYGNWRRGTGLLNNELYVGRLIWNRQRFVKDPETGLRQARPNPAEVWIIEDVPHLRIVEDALWRRVKARQEQTRGEVMVDEQVRSERARRPKYLFSGLIRCGACGGGYVLVGKTHYGCANVRNRGTCTNRLTIRRDILEETVLSGLRRNLLHPDLVREFISEYQKEWNRLRREEEALRGNHVTELARVERQIANIIGAIKQGLFASSMKAELDSLEERKVDLLRSVGAVEELPRLHPGLAGIYQRKVAELTLALNDDAVRTEAATALRSLLGAIRLIPEDGVLRIELVGELAGILALGNGKSPSAVGTGALSTLVAGTGFEPVTFRL